MPTNLLADLEPRFARVEAQKADVLARVAALDDAAQNRPLSPGGWSPRALVHHLVLAEEQTLEHIAAAATTAAGAQAQTAAKAPRRRPALAHLVSATMRLGVPVPAPPNMVPPAQSLLFLDESARRWDALRERLHARLEQITPETASAPIALHPIIGPLRATETLDLMESHLVYHLRQIARRERQSGTGGAVSHE